MEGKPVMPREARQLNPSRRRRGLTLLELLVTVGLVAIVIVSVSQIFRITSDAAAVTEANASLVKKVRIINESLEREVGNLAPDSFLAIVGPPPIRNTREISTGPIFPLQRDAIAFLARGNVGEYESATDPTVPTTLNPDLGPVTAAEAIVYFGPGNAMTQNTTIGIDLIPLEQGSLFANQWPFLHRTILLVPQTNIPNRATGFVSYNMDAQLSLGGLFNAFDGLPGDYASGRTDIVRSSASLRANVQTVAQLLMNRDWDTELAIATPPITPLWSRNQVPATVSANVNATHLRNFYRRNGAALTFGLADFRVEWTDGRPVDPYGPDGFPDSGDEDMTTRWFGVRPDPDVAVTAVNNVVYKAFKRQQADIAIDQSGLLPFQLAEARRQEQAINDLFRDRIEWPQGSSLGDNNTMYRAIWRSDTWEYRPKALRFTYRLYDQNQRIKNNTEVDLNRNGYADPQIPGQPNWQLIRMGREFSVVVPVP